jgi:hypothetical protein
MIRTNSNIYSCTITNVNDVGDVNIHRENFRLVVSEKSNIIFYEHGGEYYYPLTFEFRLIDNNILYLVQELSVVNTDELKRVLISSMEKEEHASAKYEIVVVHLQSPPKFMHKLDTLIVGEAKHIYES